MNNFMLPTPNSCHPQESMSPTYTMPFGFSEFSDATTVTTSMTCGTKLSSSSGNSENAGANANLKPKGNIGKAIRKQQSRVSRRVPTTLVNASASNFRALVQQLTGCRKSPYALSRSRRGPITLCFGADNNNASDSCSDQYEIITIFSPARNKSNYSHAQSWQQQQQQQELWHPQDQHQQHYHNNSMDAIAKANNFNLLDHDHLMDNFGVSTVSL